MVIGGLAILQVTESVEDLSYNVVLSQNEVFSDSDHILSIGTLRAVRAGDEIEIPFSGFLPLDLEPAAYTLGIVATGADPDPADDADHIEAYEVKFGTRVSTE